MLGYYSIVSGMEIHVVDTDPFSLSRNGGLTDVSLIQKYTISDENYDKRKGTLRDYLRNKREEGVRASSSSIPSSSASTATPSTTDAPTSPPPGPESVQGIEVSMNCWWLMLVSVQADLEIQCSIKSRFATRITIIVLL